MLRACICNLGPIELPLPGQMSTACDRSQIHCLAWIDGYWSAWSYADRRHGIYTDECEATQRTRLSTSHTALLAASTAAVNTTFVTILHAIVTERALVTGVCALLKGARRVWKASGARLYVARWNSIHATCTGDDVKSDQVN